MLTLREEFEKTQDAQMSDVFNKVAKLEFVLSEVALQLFKTLYPHLLTIMSGRWWLLAHGIKLAFTKYLNYSEYLATLGRVLSCAILKGVQKGLAAGIEHGKAGTNLVEVDAYNPSVEVDYGFALQAFRCYEFPLLGSLTTHKLLKMIE